MLKLELELEKIIGYNKSALFPILVLGAFLVYFFSVSDFSEEITMQYTVFSLAALG